MTAATSIAWLGSALAFAIAMAATPGPNNAMLTASGASWGFRRTLPHMVGVATGFPLMLVAVALGAGTLLQAGGWLPAGLRVLGALYMLWLAWHIATTPTGPQGGTESGRAGRRPFTFLQAALFQWVNPKAWITALGAVVTYAAPAPAAVSHQAVALAVIFLAVTFPVTAFWTLVGVGAARLLRSPAALRRFNLAMAALLVLSLLPLLAGE